MNARMLVTAIGLALSTVLAATAGTGCTIECQDTTETTIAIDLGVAVDLHALTAVDVWQGDLEYSFLAVGAEGTVVSWGTDRSGKNPETHMEVFELGAATLRAAWIAGSSLASESSWWVAGDAGTVRVSNNLGQRWESVELATEADLYGIAGFEGRPIVVGDEVVVMRIPDGSWVELPAPAEGWGQLRGVYTDNAGIYLVGLGGVIWSASDPNGEWILEPSTVTTDLLAVGRIGDDYYDARTGALGTEGTFLIRDANGEWSPVETELEVDLIDFSEAFILGAGGQIYEVDSNNGLTLRDTLPGAHALKTNYDGWATVGDEGSATTPPPYLCF